MSKGRFSDRRWALALLLLGIVALVAAALVVWHEPLFGLFGDQERLEALVAGLGPAGPLAIIALQVIQVVAGPVPGHFVGLASGYLFGPWLGALYSLIGLILGSLISVLIVRRWGRPLVERLVAPTTLARIDRFSARLGMPLLFLLFLVPLMPDDTILLVAGLTDMTVGDILLASTLGRLPGVLVSAWLGATATELTLVECAIVVAAVLAVGAPLLYWRGALEKLAWSLVERIAGRRARSS